VTWKKDDPTGDEASKDPLGARAVHEAGLVYDIGCGPSKAFPHFIGIDNNQDAQLFGIEMNPDLKVPDASEAAAARELVGGRVYRATCSSTSSTTRRRCGSGGASSSRRAPVPVPAAQGLLPEHRREGANPDHKHDFLPSDIRTR
jgi:hypothetical protein